MCIGRSVYVDRNSSTASLYVVRSGYSQKLVIVTYITQQLNHLSSPSTAPAASAAADDDDDDDYYAVAGVRIYPAIEGIDFARSISTVALSADVVRSAQIVIAVVISGRVRFITV